MTTEAIHIKGAREHNLRDLELRIPRNQLVVITGVSGSGKSSLAFDTLYAEGYRQYMESMSVRARQMLEQIKRPEVDFIHGLSPVIAIEQRTGGGGNPRSTVATATETADYARLLWSMAGEAFCPLDGGRIERRTLDDCILQLLTEPEGSRAMVLAPVMKAKVAVLREELPRLRQRGYQRVRLNGEIRELDGFGLFDELRGEVEVEVVVDRVILDRAQRSRLADSLELAFREGRDRASALVQQADGGWKEVRLSQHLACTVCGTVYEPLTPRHFSHNHPEGACPTCGGLGRTLQFADTLVVPDPSKSVKEGAIKPWRLGSKAMIIRRNAILRQLAEQVPFDPRSPWSELPETTRHLLLHGAGDRLFQFKLTGGNRKPEAMPFEGVLADLDKTRRDTTSDGLRARLTAYQTSSLCPDCQGKRLNAQARAVLLEGVNITDFLSQPIASALGFVGKLRGILRLKPFADALQALHARLAFLDEVGLGYLTLDREYGTLSGGEIQRVRLATQLGMGLIGVIYVLDEPSIGLHPRDHDRLIQSLIAMRDRGNSVIVVEHDAATMLRADHIIEMGPGAGTQGGRVVFQGTLSDCRENLTSSTGRFLSGRSQVHHASKPLNPGKLWLTVEGAAEHNLKNLDVRFPVGLLTVVCGVSGSGKSTLVNDILAQAAAVKLHRAKLVPGRHCALRGLEHFKSVVRIDQDPIGRTPRSNPATYVKLFDPLRQLFAACPLAKIRGYTAARFSFNLRGGRCERCQGDGAIKLDMQFMGDVYVPCPSCQGKRYNRETLDVRFKGYSIADVLDMTVAEAMEVFRAHPKIMEKLVTLDAVGLDYIKLGQGADTLSGGEAQRIKLALELSRPQQGQTLYMLDEPTTGLHWEDIQKLMDLLFKLRDAGNTLLLIEHHPDVIRLADWAIELGPEGGKKGGHLLFSGTPSELMRRDSSPTGRCLQPA